MKNTPTNNPHPGRMRSLTQSAGRSLTLLSVVLATLLVQPSARLGAQITNVVFSEDFEAGTIDPAKFLPDAPFFEGGKGDIAGNIVADEDTGSSVLQFTGTVSQQWWAGATLRVVPTFKASVETNVVVSVDRVKEAGIGTSSRSALWIMDSTQTRFVLFADNRNENHWEYNRNIGEAGDAPTGSGTAIDAFNATGSPFRDEGLHKMTAVANGQTVKLFLDDTFGAEVKFPFDTIVVHVGSYARANNDTADTKFDNLAIAGVGTASFSTTALTISTGQTSAGNVKVRIPIGSNKDSDVVLRVVSSVPTIAVPTGAVGGSLTVTFAKGGPTEKSIDVQSIGPVGGTVFTIENDIGLSAGNSIAVTAIQGPGVRLVEDFSGSELDATKWIQNDRGFEAGTGTFSVGPGSGTLTISGTLDQSQYWGGASLKTVGGYTATKDLPLVVTLDRLSVTGTKDDGTESTAVRTGVYLANDTRTRFFFFGQNLGENGWEVNLNPGNPTGSGTTVAAFNSKNDTTAHSIKLIANGQNVEVYLDGLLGGTFPFALSAGIHLEVGAYARALLDQVTGVFDNVKIENTLPCISVTPADISAVAGDAPKKITINIPKLLNSTGPATVTVTSSDPKVVTPAGGANGGLAVVFAAGTSLTKSVDLNIVGVGNATVTLSNPDTCVNQQVLVSVTPAPVTLLTDSFSTEDIDPSLWRVDTMALAPNGVATEDSAAVTAEGLLKIGVTNSTGAWPGITLFTQTAYSAGATTPITFAIDRVKLDKVLVTGTAAKQRTGIWVSDASRLNFVFFSEFKTWDGSAGGWDYTVVRDSVDGYLPQAFLGGTAISAFTPSQFNDTGKHRLKAVANGATVKLYLDEVFGVEVPFAVSDGLVFGFGAYVLAATDVVYGNFDNATVLGIGSTVGTVAAKRLGSGDVEISWTGAGVLQSAPSLSAGAVWTDVSPAPTNSKLTLTPDILGAQRYYRLRQ